MNFKFIVKDEDLPKPTLLSQIHVCSFFLGIGVTSAITNATFIIIFVVLEIVQVIYMFLNYRKIVWERYANSRLRTITISFIATNVYFTLLAIISRFFDFILLPLIMIVSMIIIFVVSLLVTIYLRNINFVSRVKSKIIGMKNFSFPFYKYSGIVPIFFTILSFFFKSKVYLGISLILLAVGLVYAGLGEYIYIKRKDELDRLIKYEASFIAMQLLPAIIFPLFFLERFYNIKIPWFYFLIGFYMVHTLIQTLINRKYE
jgi:hypothetical protein